MEPFRRKRSLGIFEQRCQNRQGAIKQPFPHARAIVPPAVNVGGKNVCHTHRAEGRCNDSLPCVPVSPGRRGFPDPRQVIPIGIDEIRQDRRRLDHGAFGQTIKRHLGKQSPSLCPGQLCREFVGTAQCDPAMFAPMAQANEPVGVAGGPDAQTKARKFRIPDAVFRLAQRQLAPRKVAIEKCPAPGLSPRGDHMAIAHIKTGFESRGIPVVCGDHMAFNGVPAAEQSQHLTH